MVLHLLVVIGIWLWACLGFGQRDFDGWLGHWMLQYSMICLMILVLIWDFWFGDDWGERERES